MAHSSLPMCIFGDGCLARLTDDRHDQSYIHEKSILPICPNEPGCSIYQEARSFIINGENTKNIKEAQNHTSLYYHKPVYQPSIYKRVIIGRRNRPRSITSDISLRGDVKSQINLHDLKDLLLRSKQESIDTPSTTPPSGNTEIEDRHTYSSDIARNKITDIPKLNLSKSAPSSPVSVSDFPEATIIQISPKNGIVKTTPKGRKDKLRKGDDIASLRSQIEIISNHVIVVQRELDKLSILASKLENTQSLMKEQLWNLRDQLIKVCLDE